MIIAIIQARMGSSRLPNKVMKILEGKTIIEHVIARVQKSNLINEVFVATSINKNNIPLIKFCLSKNIRVFIGSEEDVLDRFYQLAKLIHPIHIVRITSDCPVIDTSIIDSIIKAHLVTNSDYTSNTISDTFPDGLDTEIFTFSALEKTWREAKLFSEREHVTPYIKKNPDYFSINSIISPVDYNKMRWTIDTEFDYKFLKLIFKKLYNQNNFFGINEILKLLKEEPYLEAMNSNIQRNEGYLISLKKDANQ